MKAIILFWIIVSLSLVQRAFAEDFDADQFAKGYFEAWAASQRPGATKQDLERYLAFLTDDVGHQHLPYDPDDTRSPTGKQDMREGMGYYLGAHTEYEGTLLSQMAGHNVVVIKYRSSSKGIHPQTQQEVSQQDMTVEVLEIEDGKVAVIRKYSP